MATAKTNTAKAKAAAKQTTASVETAVTETVEAVSETANAVADIFGAKGFEVPEVFRSMAENSVEQAREHYAQFKASAEDATDLMEETFETARDGALNLQHKALDAAKQNSDAVFDFTKQIMGVTSVADAIQLQARFAREQFDALVDYSKDFQSGIAQVTEDTTAPSKAAFSKALSAAK